MTQFDSAEETEQLAALPEVLKTIGTPEGLVRAIAGGMCSEHPAVVKACKAGLAKHPDEKLAAFFRAEKRKYYEIQDAKKLAKVVSELTALGVDAARLTAEMVRVSAARGAAMGLGVPDAFLAAALAIEGSAPAVFAAMADVPVVLLPKLKSLPPGLSALRGLRKLHVLADSFKSAAHVDELAKIPQPFFLQLSIRDVKLELFDACKTNVSGLGFADSASALVDLSPLRGWTKLANLELKGTGVTDLSPLAALPLTSIDLSGTAVSDLSPLASTPLSSLTFQFAKSPLDLSPLCAAASRAHATLTHVSLWGSPVVSLEPLAACPKLVEVRLDPNGTWPGADALAAARPDVKILR